MREPLRRYHAILRGQSRPACQSSKCVPVQLRQRAGEEEMWESHSRSLRLAPSEEGAARPSLMDLKVELAERMLHSCRMCEHRCGVDRTAGARGKCGVLEAKVASYFMHYGEEKLLVPSYTIFFAGCNMGCVHCQNFDISTDPEAGRHLPAELMARRLENLSEVGQAGFKVTLVREWAEKAKNVNWVGGEPTPNLAYVLQVLRETRSNLPQIWNSNMYMSEESMRLLEGAVDVYLADFKYGNDDCARKYSKVDDYFRIVSRNHRIGAEHADLLIRHLMLPGHLECCTYPILEWLADNVPEASVNVMSQYRPMHLAHEHPELMARVSGEDLQAALRRARELRLQLV